MILQVFKTMSLSTWIPWFKSGIAIVKAKRYFIALRIERETRGLEDFRSRCLIESCRTNSTKRRNERIITGGSIGSGNIGKKQVESGSINKESMLMNEEG